MAESPRDQKSECPHASMPSGPKSNHRSINLQRARELERRYARLTKCCVAMGDRGQRWGPRPRGFPGDSGSISRPPDDRNLSRALLPARKVEDLEGSAQIRLPG